LIWYSRIPAFPFWRFSTSFLYFVTLVRNSILQDEAIPFEFHWCLIRIVFNPFLATDLSAPGPWSLLRLWVSPSQTYRLALDSSETFSDTSRAVLGSWPCDSTLGRTKCWSQVNLIFEDLKPAQRVFTSGRLVAFVNSLRSFAFALAVLASVVLLQLLCRIPTVGIGPWAGRFDQLNRWILIRGRCTAPFEVSALTWCCCFQVQARWFWRLSHLRTFQSFRAQEYW